MTMWDQIPWWGLIAALVLVQFGLFVARERVHEGLRTAWAALTRGLRFAGVWLRGVARDLDGRNHDMLIAEATREQEYTIEREFDRLNRGFATELAKYPATQRRLEEVVSAVHGALDGCSDAPPEVPGWPEAAEKLLAMPDVGEGPRKRLVGEVKQLARESEKRVLQSYRAESAKRHKALSAMAPKFLEARALLRRVGNQVSRALETTQRIDAHMERYEKLRSGDSTVSRTLLFDQIRLFVISVLITAVAFGGALVNFHLIAVPMSELVPTTARVAGTPVPLIAALVIVLMEAAAGVFLLEALGVTEMLPGVARLDRNKRRMIALTAFAALVVLASVEASLAVLRESIVESNAALERSLYGEPVRNEGFSSIPMLGQAALGFMLPFVLAMVAIPLETLIRSVRYVVTSALAALLHFAANTVRLLRVLVGGIGAMLHAAFDVFIGVPLVVSRLARGRGASPDREAPTRVLRDVTGPQPALAGGKAGRP